MLPLYGHPGTASPIRAPEYCFPLYGYPSTASPIRVPGHSFPYIGTRVLLPPIRVPGYCSPIAALGKKNIFLFGALGKKKKIKNLN